MTTIDIQELSPTTAEAVKRALANGEDVFLTDDKKEQLAKVVSIEQPANTSPSNQKRGLVGSMKGFVTYMADDFNEPLDDFKEYMPDWQPSDERPGDRSPGDRSPGDRNLDK